MTAVDKLCKDAAKQIQQFMSRPKTSEQNALSSRIILRLTTEEYKVLNEFAKISGKTLSAMVREKITKGKFPSPKRPRLDLQTYAELKKIGVNLNQMTRAVNGGRNVMPLELYKMIMKLREHLDLVIAKLIYDSRSENR